MNSHDFNILVPWIIAHGYLIFLIVATIEGPITTIAAGVVTALGYFNLYLIIALAILADIGGDVIYFYIGHSSHNLIHSRFFRFFGLTEERIEKTQEFLHTKTWRAVFLAKLSPVTGPLGTVALGAFRPKFQSFFWPALGISIVKSTFFLLLGYYFSQSYIELNKVIDQGQYIILGIAIVAVIIYFVYSKVVSQITKGMSE